MAYCYILYSPSLNRFYTGSTELETDQRLELHLARHYGNKKYTAIASDWELYLEISCDSIKQARQVEAHIKKMKSKNYIINLKKYPEMIEKLLSKY